MKIAISTSAFGSNSPEAMQLLRDKGVGIRSNPFGRRLTEAEIIEHLQGVDGLLAGLEPLNENVLSKSGSLKAIARVGSGVANIDFKAVEKYGIKVSNTPDGPTFAVAEMTLTALLSILRDLPRINARMHGGEWPKKVNRSLSGKTLLIVGFGRIGRKVAELARAFQTKILVCDPRDVVLPRETQKVSMTEGLKMADIVSLHVDGEGEIIGEKEFELMKNDVIILNSARGALINEVSMIKNLKNEKIFGAWFDAFWDEPYEGELQKFDNVILTPHTSTYTEVCRATMEFNAVQNILNDLGL
jgi:D-3-phosphoglycerate dehydrogenase / 2-oxoglutarate reductase